MQLKKNPEQGNSGNENSPYSGYGNGGIYPGERGDYGSQSPDDNMNYSGLGSSSPQGSIYQQNSGGPQSGMYQPGGNSNSQGMYQPGGNANPQGMYSSEPVIRKSGGINPLFIIIPALIILILIGVSQYKKIFGKAEYIPGTVTDNVYKNEYFDFSLKLSDNWSVTRDVVDPEAVKKTLDTKAVVYELQADNYKSSNYKSGNALLIAVRQTSYNIKETGTDIDKLINDVKEETVKVLSQDYTITDTKNDSVTIGGKTCKGFVITGEVDGQKMSMVYYFIFKGNYVCYIGATGQSEGKARLVITNNMTIFDE